MNKISELLQLPDTTVVDVRTPGEFMGGHVAGSINIPLDEIPRRLDELKAMKNIVLCCASGMRSMNATAYLIQNGITSYNGGAWTEVNYYSNNN
ncbi:MAG: rhodanese-like domain-containing protein [Bacteroidota bacterium]